MTTPDTYRQRMIDLLDRHAVEYRLFEHRPIRNYDDAEEARKESGFFGTESKSVVITAGDRPVVYMTLAGTRLDFKAIRRELGAKKARLATPEELWDGFAAEAGAAYPFGFADDIAIVVDPAVFAEEWLLLSAVLPTQTLQVRGPALRSLFEGLPNPVTFSAAFSAAPAPAPIDESAPETGQPAASSGMGTE